MAETFEDPGLDVVNPEEIPVGGLTAEIPPLPNISILSDPNNLNPDYVSFLSSAGVGTPSFEAASSTNLTPVYGLSGSYLGLGFGTGSNAPLWVVDSPDTVLMSLDASSIPTWLKKAAAPGTSSTSAGKSTATTPSPDSSIKAILDIFDVVPAGLMSDILGTVLKSSPVIINENDKGSSYPHNACWLQAGQTVSVTTRLSFSLNKDGVLDDLKNALSSQLGFKIDISDIGGPELLFTRTVVGIPKVDQGKTTFDVGDTSEFTIKIPIAGFMVWIRHSDSETDVNLTDTSGTDFWTKLSSSKLNGPGESSANPNSVFPNLFPKVYLWSASVGFTGKQIWWRIRLLLPFKPKKERENQLVFCIAYDSRIKTFTGSMVRTSFFPTASQRCMPLYDPLNDLPTDAKGKVWADFSNIHETYSLKNFFPNLPPGIPTDLAQAQISVVTEGPKATLAIAVVKSPEDTQPMDADAPIPTPFEWTALSVNADYSKTTDGYDVSLNLYSSFALNPRPQDRLKYQPAILWVGLSYEHVVTKDITTGAPVSNDRWLFSGHVENLQFGALAGYFEPDYQEPIVAVLGKLAIKVLDVDYTYNSTGAASSFLLSGALTLGQLELKFIYQYASSDEPQPAAQIVAEKNPEKLGDKKPIQPKPPAGKTKTSDWSFDAWLGAAVDNATIGSIADSIMDNASDKLPDFVKDISINTAEGGKSPVQLQISKNVKDGVKQAVFTLTIIIGAFTVTFVQISSQPVIITDPSQTKAKQILRVSVDEIPGVNKIPLVDELPQPFDKLVYQWVRDATGAGGFTKAELDAINAKLTKDPIMYKSTTSARQIDKGVEKPVASSSIVDAAVVMPAGHHFVVVDDGEAKVDHVFNNAKSGQKDDGSTKPAPAVPDDNKDPPETKADPPPTKGSVTKKTKFLTISSVALQFKSGILWVTLDATIALGPISMSLLGFGVGVPISEIKLDKLSSLTGAVLEKFIEDIQWQLHGLGLSFDKPPLLIAGVFEHNTVVVNNKSIESYRGGVGISFPPYVFVAVGEYSIVTDTKSGASYKSIFIFAKLDGPIIELEFATISGVRLGFGYNSIVRSPTNAELTQFPFISDQGIDGAGNNPLKILDSMTKPTATADAWVTPKQDAYWFAIGMSVSAAEILEITAVAMVGFHDSGLTLSLFADAIGQLPPEAPPNLTIMYVEIAMVAEMNFGEGYFRVEASLAPTSHIYVPMCHIYGGFALCYWFGPNPHAGDFVFTIGGYHKLYTPPAWYPVVRRLGVSFTCGDNLSITGEAYFAITPQVAMGGGALHVSLAFGPIEAYLDASFDALINFSPLHYIADLSVSVGVSFNLDFLFVHIHIHVHVGASLHLEGPEFGGKAHVDFYLLAFDVYFGAAIGIPDPIPLLEFWDVVHKPGPVANSSQPAIAEPPTKETDPQMGNLGFALEDGAFPLPQRDNKDGSKTTPNAGSGSVWNVKGGAFQFRIATDFAVSGGFVRLPGDEITPDPTEPTDATLPQGTFIRPIDRTQPTGFKDLNPVYSKPMQTSTPIKSPLTFGVKNAHGEYILDWQIRYVRKDVPASVWGQYDRGTDPNHGSTTNVLNSDATIELAMGLSIHSPPPKLAQAKMPAFNATRFAMLEIPREILRDAAGKLQVLHWLLPPPLPDQTTGLPRALDPVVEKKAGTERWAGVQKAWNEAANPGLINGEDGMAGIFAGVLGWNPNPRADAGDGAVPVKVNAAPRMPWELVGDLPGVLVGKETTKGLAEYYLALPRLSDGM